MSTTISRKQIRHVMISVWDPISIADEPACANEYDAYVDRIWHACGSGSVDSVASTLLSIETNEMSLPGDRAKAYRAARAMIDELR